MGLKNGTFFGDQGYSVAVSHCIVKKFLLWRFFSSKLLPLCAVLDCAGDHTSPSHAILSVSN